MGSLPTVQNYNYKNKLWIVLLAILSFFIAIPFVKANIGIAGIILYFIITIAIQIIFKKNNSLFLAWVALSPTIGQGIFIGSLTLSILDIITLSYLLRDNNKLFYQNKNISKAYLVFIVLILTSYLINTKLAINASIYKELLLLLVILKYSLKKHSFADWIGLLKSLQLAAIIGIFLHIFELITKGSVEGNIFRVSSINAIHQYLAVGIISFMFDRYRKGAVVSFLVIIIYIIYAYLSLSRTGMVFSLIILFLYIYTYGKLKKINFYSFTPIIVVFLCILSYFGYNYLLEIDEIRAGSNLERLGVISYYLQLIRNNFWWGIGFGNWQQGGKLLQDGLISVSLANGDFSNLNPHNTFLRFLTDTGIFATLTFLYIFYKNYIIAKKNELLHSNKAFFTTSLFVLLFISFFLADNSENIHFWACSCLGATKLIQINNPNS